VVKQYFASCGSRTSRPAEVLIVFSRSEKSGSQRKKGKEEKKTSSRYVNVTTGDEEVAAGASCYTHRKSFECGCMAGAASSVSLMRQTSETGAGPRRRPSAVGNFHSAAPFPPLIEPSVRSPSRDLVYRIT
jgi:hypothetical protein